MQKTSLVVTSALIALFSVLNLKMAHGGEETVRVNKTVKIGGFTAFEGRQDVVEGGGGVDMAEAADQDGNSVEVSVDLDNGDDVIIIVPHGGSRTSPTLMKKTTEIIEYRYAGEPSIVR
jgi:hypothetical protein